MLVCDAIDNPGMFFQDPIHRMYWLTPEQAQQAWEEAIPTELGAKVLGMAFISASEVSVLDKQGLFRYIPNPFTDHE